MKVLKIGAVWCAGCLVMRPRWQQIESEMTDLETEYLDYDESRQELEKRGIKTDTLPTFIFYTKDGKEYARLLGEIVKDVIISTIRKGQELDRKLA